MSHAPETVLHYGWGVVADTQLQKENFLLTSSAEKIFVPLRCLVPAFVLHKGIIAAEIHGHGLAAVRADG